MRNTEFYLKRLAALQFPGSIDNFSTRTPIHILQEQTSEQEEISLDKVAACLENGEDIVFFNDDGDSYDSLEEIVLSAGNVELPFKYTKEDIETYNAKQIEMGLLPFFTWEQIVAANGTISSSWYIQEIDTDYVSEYLELYDVDCQQYRAFRYKDEFENKAIGFTHKGILETEKEMENHIFQPTRTYAWNDGNEEFKSIINYVMQEGQKMLDRELEGFSIDWGNAPLSREEIEVKVKDEKESTLPIGRFTVLNTRYLVAAYFSIYLKEIKNYSENWTREARMSVIFADGKGVDLPYPFACDKYCEKYRTDEGALKTYAYALYASL